MNASPAREFDPVALDQIARKARIVLGALLLKAAIKADLSPSTAILEYFREHVEEERRYEAAVAQRLDSRMPLDPGVLPVPAIQRVDQG